MFEFKPSQNIHECPNSKYTKKKQKKKQANNKQTNKQEN